jgi:hypothetical protein
MATSGEVSFIRRRVLTLPSPVFTLEPLDGPALACILHYAAPLFPAFPGSRLTLPILSKQERMDQEMCAPSSAR